MKYKTFLLWMALLSHSCISLLTAIPAKALPPEAQGPCAAATSSQSRNLDYGRGTYWATCNKYKFVFQTDGNVVLYNPSNSPLWATGTNGSNADKFSVQADGNVVLYAGNRPLWASDTSGNPGGLFVVQSDGNVVVYKSGGQAVFNTRTNGGQKSTLSASRTWLTRYFPQLLSWSEEMWNKESGDGYHFDNLPSTKGVKTGISETTSELKQISKDLSKALLQSERYMTTGYAYDVNPSYDATKISHAGIDYESPVGQKVLVVASGKIIKITENNPGKFITVESEDGKRWIYGHINSSKTENSTVKSGDQIGTVYNQGSNTHFHIEVHTAPFDDGRIIGGIPYRTLGEFNFVLKKTVSPLQAYWECRNR